MKTIELTPEEYALIIRAGYDSGEIAHYVWAGILAFRNESIYPSYVKHIEGRKFSIVENVLVVDKYLEKDLFKTK